MNTSQGHQAHQPTGPNWSRINQWLLWVGLASAVGWMFFRHNAHLGQLLPFLLLLACPLMHVFGHGGHGSHGRHGGHGDAKSQDDPQRQRPARQSGHQH